MAFTHLHVHGESSILDGMSTPDDLAAIAVRENMSAIALTDHGSLGSSLRFARACAKAKVKPIIGMEAYLALGSRFEHNETTLMDADTFGAEGGKTKRYEHITLIAKNAQGWRSLVRLHNAAQDSVWYVPRIDYELMERYSEGIICLTGCLGGPILGPISQHVMMHRNDPDPQRLAAMREEYAEIIEAFSQGTGYTDDANVDALMAERDPETFARLTELRTAIERADFDGLSVARTNLDRLIGIYGTDHVFVEVMEHGIDQESQALPYVYALARQAGVKIVATNDSHYSRACDATTHDGWLAARTSKAGYDALNDPTRFRFHGQGYHVRSEAEMRALREEPEWAQACDNTMLVAAMVENDIMPTGGVHLPAFPIPPGYESNFDYFVDLVKRGAVQRYGLPMRPDVLARLNREAGVIRDLGLIDYFLIDHDLLAWARSDYTPADWISLHDGEYVNEETRERKKPITIGPARGSGGGSCVLYCLGIVDIDPLRHHLLFERFLDPTRVGMPDVDTDFEKSRRDEGYAYLVARYGHSRIARIGTVGRYATKAAIDAGCRLMQCGEYASALKKLIPDIDGDEATINQLINADIPESAPFRAKVAQIGDDRLERALVFAQAFAGIISSEGIHACGVLVCDRDIDDFVPVRRAKDPDAPRITTWDAHDVGDDLGLLKLDLLGLRTMDIIHEACDLAGITPAQIPDPDNQSPSVTAAWEMLKSGNTASIFQLESDGITELVEMVEPHCWNNLTAIAALYRPGPMGAGLHTEYAQRLNGRAPTDYGTFSTDPEEVEVIKSVLGETFGIPVYQEQAMILGQKIAGFDDALTNRLRKAISKKKVEEFAELGRLFIAGGAQDTMPNGSVKLSFSEETCRKIWAALEGSARYSFNKSHSAAYGLLAFQTAWLKSTYPAQFACAVLTHTPRTKDFQPRRMALLASVERMGVKILAPSLNASDVHARPVGSCVRFGLADIKDVGNAAAQIVAERHSGGPYTSMSDLAARCPGITTSVLVALAEAGAFDEFGPRRGHVMVTQAVGARPATPIPNVEWGDVTLWVKQKTRIGQSFGRHPLDIARQQYGNFNDLADEDGFLLGSEPITPDDIGQCSDGQNVWMIATIAQSDLVNRGRGLFATMTLESATAAVDAVAWSRTLERVGEHVFRLGTTIVLSGKVRLREVEVEADDGETVTITRAEVTISDAHEIAVADRGRGLKTAHTRDAVVAALGDCDAEGN